MPERLGSGQEIAARRNPQSQASDSANSRCIAHQSGSANANEEFLAVLPDQLLNQGLRHLRPTLPAIIPGLANDLIKNCAIIFDDDRLDACPTNIESDGCLRLHLNRFIDRKNRCN